MPRRTAIIVSIGLAVTGSVGFLWKRAPALSAVGNAGRQGADPAAEDVATLKREVASLKRLAVAQALRPLAATPAQPGEPPRGDPALPARRFAPGEQRKLVGDALESRFAGEPIDPSWSAARVQMLRETFARSLPGINVTQAACASTLCKLAVEHSDGESQTALMEKLSGAEGVDAEVYYLFDREAVPPRTTLYVARPGQTLPRVRL